MNEVLKNRRRGEPKSAAAYDFTKIIDAFKKDKYSEYVVFPGFADVHVHLREPGFSYKETIRTGTLAAARGGYTSVCAMPNLNPFPHDTEGIKKQLHIINTSAVVDVFPYGTITYREEGEKVSDMEALAKYAVAFSDDGRGVADKAVMREAMLRAKSLGRIIASHCELNPKQPGESGGEEEWRQVERDLSLAQETGCKYHVCHVSTKESVNLIRGAKKSGVDVSCETAPHYLILDKTSRKDSGRFKMNPPLRTKQDREALAAGVCDGTVDMIATDHAPHSEEEKSRGFKDSLPGVTGLEVSFPALYTFLVKGGLITLEKLLGLITRAPRERFGLSQSPDDFTVFDLNESFTIDPGEFISKGKSTPFEGISVFGRCHFTHAKGKNVWVSKRAEEILRGI
ncbi:MAG: dihydroorotase [Eubacteriales bacterium]